MSEELYTYCVRSTTPSWLLKNMSDLVMGGIMNIVVFDSVVKSYGEVQALRGASFRVPKGCIAGLIGPNGAGKSTILKIAIGALRRDYGDVEVLGYDPWINSREVRALVGFLPETPNFPSVRVWRLLMHVAKLKVGNGAEHEVRKVVRLTGIRSIMDRVASKLSRGFRQRVALALAMIGEPKLLILDEPAANLDPNARVELYELLKLLREDYRVNILLSTHILAEAKEVVDYLIVISKGLIIAEGWIPELVRSTKLSVKAVFKLGKGINARELINEIMKRYDVEGVGIKGDEITIEASSEVIDEIKEYLSRYDVKLVEEKSVNLVELYKRLVGGG